MPTLAADAPQDETEAEKGLLDERVAPVPERGSIPWKKLAIQAALLWLASRAAIIVFTYFAVIFNAQRTNAPANQHAYGPSTLLTSWKQWDVNWYAHIVQSGYFNWHASAFFPFFPLVTRLLTAVIGQAHVLGAEMIVSNTGTLVAFVAIAWLAAWEFGSTVSSFAVRAAAAYPLMFFTFAGYADSWFLAWCALALLLARRGMWYYAALCAFMASVTRPTALVLIVPLVWEYGRQLHVRGLWPPRALPWRTVTEGITVAISVPLGFAAYGLYLWTRFGDPLEWVKAQGAWDHKTVMPWNWIHMALNTLWNTPAWTFPQARVLLDLGAVVLFAILTVLGARRLPIALTLFMVSVIGVLITSAVPLDFDPFNAESRYLIMSVPIFVLLGYWMAKRPWLDLLIVGGGFLLQGAFAMFWIRGGWIV